MIIEVVKFIGLLAHLLEAFEFIESFIKRRTQQKPNPVGLNRRIIMTKFEKIETGLIIVFEVVLCTLKNGKKFRNLLKKKVSKTKQSKKQIKIE